MGQVAVPMIPWSTVTSWVALKGSCPVRVTVRVTRQLPTETPVTSPVEAFTVQSAPEGAEKELEALASVPVRAPAVRVDPTRTFPG